MSLAEGEASEGAPEVGEAVLSGAEVAASTPPESVGTAVTAPIDPLIDEAALAREAPPATAKIIRVTDWPMWVIGFTLLVDNMDQYIVRGSSNQIEHAFGVGDIAISVLFAAFILVNGLVTMPAGYLGDRWNRTRAMAVVIVAWSVVSALGGVVPTSAFWLLIVIRASLGAGQAVTDPSGSSVIADYYGTERRGRAFSIQQCLSYVGLGLGLAIGGALGPIGYVVKHGHVLHVGSGWRIAFFVSIVPGLIIAAMLWRLHEPALGTADRGTVTNRESGQMELAEDRPPLFPHGFGPFMRDMVEGLRKDVGTIWAIPTMRYALIGVSTVGFVVTAVATWMPNFYELQLGQSQSHANATFGLLAIVGGIPGTLLGGRLADRWISKYQGARVVIPAVCIFISATLFWISFIPMAFGLVVFVQLLGFLAATACVPPLRAGLSDAAPAHLRGAGFGAFNLFSVVFGAAAAPLVVSGIANELGHNYRTAFIIIMPIAFVGAACLMLARGHIEKDAAKVFEAVVMAMAAAQAKEAAYAAEEAASHGAADGDDGVAQVPPAEDGDT